MSVNSMLTLAGKTLVITRPAHQAQVLSTRLKNAGATVIACPLLDIQPVLCEAFNKHEVLSTYSLAIFTSPNAVEYFIKQLPHANPQVLQSLKIASIGKATTQALTHYGLTVNYAPSTYFTSEELLELPNFKVLAPQAVLLVKGKGGRTLLAETLVSRGMKVTLCEVYERIKLPLPCYPIEWSDVDWVMITSLEALEHLVSCWQGAIALDHVALLVGSERIAQAAITLGFTTINTAKNPSDAAMWDALHRI